MQDPLSLEIPAQMTIHLDRGMREAMKRIAAVYRHESDEELVERALRYGLVAMLQEQYEQVSPGEIAENSNAAKRRMTELEGDTSRQAVAKRALAFPNRMNMMIELKGPQDWAELHAQDAEYDRETARIERDLGLADFPEDEGAMPPPHVERYVAAPISGDLRERLEDFLSEHPELDREAGIAALLRLGLDKTQVIFMGKGESLKEKKAEEMLRLAERLYAKAHRRCVG